MIQANLVKKKKMFVHLLSQVNVRSHSRLQVTPYPIHVQKTKLWGMPTILLKHQKYVQQLLI